MQTLEFTRAVSEIAREMRISELLSIIDPWLKNKTPQHPVTEPEKDKFADLVLASNASYNHLLMRPNTGKILRGLNVGDVFEGFRIRVMLSQLSSVTQVQSIPNTPQLFAALFSFGEMLRSLQRWQSTTHQFLQDEKIGQVAATDGIVELEVIEYADEAGISPKRLEILSRSVTSLHGQLSILLGIEGDTLMFKYFDSGSGVLAAIECAKGIAETFNTLLREWWDKIKYYRYDTYDKKVDAVSKTLTLMETIQQKVESHAITNEVGENLKVRILREVDKLTGIGVTLPLPESPTIDQRQLLTELRNTKLLGTGETVTEPGENLPGAREPKSQQ